MAVLKTKQKPAHAAGIYSDMTLDGPEIGTLVAVVDRAKNLPNRKTMGKQDPYCAMRLAKEAKKTGTDRRGGQTPKWDQELRFTVHDSPDYYKLKCSVFNDDKKTELIGEAWVDLTDVIKLGGGQSDLWQQLTFRGKYAGEIRMELTFYDTREKPQEKKRRDKQMELNDMASDLSMPAQRSLGPREIKRRPLPASPAAAAAPKPPPVATESIAPPPPPKVSLDHQQQAVHAPVALRPRPRSPSPLPNQQVQEQYQTQIEDYSPGQYHHDQQPSRYHRPQSSWTERQQPWQQPLGQQHRDLDMVVSDPYRMPSDGQQEFAMEHQAHQAASFSPYPDEGEIWQPRRPQSFHAHSEPITPQHSSPAYRPSPASMHSDSQIVRYGQQRQDISPHGTPSYPESPLKQTLNQQDYHQPSPQADVPPPLPPKHRDTPPRRPRSEYPPSAYIPQPLRIGNKRTSVSDRSPLQSLEDGYGMQRQGQIDYDPQTPQRHSMYVRLPAEQSESPNQQLQLYSRRNTSEMQPTVSDPQLPQQRPAPRNRRNSYEIRHPSFGQQVVAEPESIDEGHHSSYEDSYQPTVEDAPPSPGLQPVIARKAVGSRPNGINGVPFGPDAYDVLNPASSPVTNEHTPFETPAQAKEAQRMREVEKLRELGPIIGNDGREIDPSDHLPADTWAPEPERKNRKPEHVIHIRTKNDANRPAGARGSPIVIRNNRHSTPQNSSAPPSQPVSAPNSSPATRPTPNSFIGGKNRLQKAPPAQVRPLSNQPYASPSSAAVSSPALASSPQHMSNDEFQYNERPSQQRRPSYDSRTSGNLVRPPLSEYQVPVGNVYTPRRGSYDPYSSPVKAIEYKPYDSTPSKQPLYNSNYSAPTVENDRRSSYDNRRQSYDRRNSYDNRSDYSYENHVEPQHFQDQQQQQQPPPKHYDSPLAAEMSLIDIGPSRNSYHQGSMGRSMARRW